MSIFVRFNTMAMTLDEQINQALEVLRRGGIILYPTDTVWGIGCDATNPEAVGKIYALKKSENNLKSDKISVYIEKIIIIV
jgi:L-threonylcarbamoyladenylate synthase